MFYSKGENRRKGWLYSVFRITRRQLVVFWVLLALSLNPEYQGGFSHGADPAERED